MGDPDDPPGPSDDSPRFGIGVLLVIAGSVGMWWSTAGDNLGWVLLALSLLGLGIWFTHQGLPRLTGFDEGDEAPAALLAGWMIIASLLVVLCLVHLRPWTIALGTFGGSMVVAPLALTLRRKATAGSRDRSWMLGGLAVYGTGGVLLVTGTAALIGFALLMVGLVLYRTGLLPAIQKRRDTDRTPAWLAFAAFAAGVTMMFIAVRGAELAIGIAGTLIIFPALIALAVVMPHIDYGPLDDKAFVTIGALLFTAAVFSLWSSGLDDLPAWGVAAGLALVGVALGRSGEIVVLGIVAAAALAWVTVDRPVEETSQPPFDDSLGRIVAIGDSYISGEGADEYLAGTNVVGEHRNECRRAPTAYAYRVAEAMQRELSFYACSGATTARLLLPEEEALRTPENLVGQMPDSPTDIPGALVQLAHLEENPDDIDVVLVSIGGNDARFSEIAQGCFLPGTCAELRSLWLSNIETIGPSVRAVYRQIKEIVGDDVAIVAMPYPMMLGEDACGWSLVNGDEHSFLFEFVTTLNQQIELSAAREGINFFEAGLFAFDGDRICERGRPSSPAMNLLRLEPPAGDPIDALSPSTWIHNSMHPTADGHRRTADLLEPYLNDLLAGNQPNPPPDDDALLQVRSIRVPQPVVISAALVAEIADPANPAECRALAPGGFAERLLLVDQLDEQGTSRRVPSFVLADADPNEPACYKQGNAPWTTVQPRPVELAETDMEMASAMSPVVIEASTDPPVVSVQPVVPDDGDRLMVLYRGQNGDPRLRIVDFCSKIDDVEVCPATVRDWTNLQLAETARQAAAPVVTGILAGWFAIVGLNPRRLERSLVAGGGRSPTPLYERIVASTRPHWDRRTGGR